MIYFDLESFISVKNEFNKYVKGNYNDTMELLLINFDGRNLHYDQACRIDIEQNMDINGGKIRSLMEWINRECKETTEVSALIKKMKMKKILDDFKGISVTEAIGMALSIV